MKFFYVPVLLLLLASCNQKEKNDSAANRDSIKIKPASKPTVVQSKFKSALKPGEDLEIHKIYSDVVEFVDYNTDFDYYFIDVKKNGELIGLNTNSDDIAFNRGDILEVKWKIDSIFIAGDGGTLEFTEWLVDAKKIKDGNVTLFKKKHPKPIKIYEGENDSLSDSYKSYIYTIIEYYLANTDNEVLKENLKDPIINLIYWIEDGEKNGRSYTVIKISDDLENHSNIIQSLYFDNESRKLYEYDSSNDKLIEFK
ncbi:hypothetical protein ACFFLS_20700 [Flavobacterium procerum]|uniref:DUF2314 domain-containing protein n=1 Tax=Flavobacterium procerum TaxID=1455569 RepID=A0ABV6BVM8_9FLAO